VKLFEKQAQDYSLKIIYEDVKELDHQDDLFHVTSSHQAYQSRIVVIATGTKPRLFTELVIPEPLADQVFYEVYPVMNLEDKRIAIVGGGDAAFDYALNLGKTNDILILNRSERTSCLPLLWDRVKASPRITYQPQTSITQATPSLDNRILLAINSPTGPDSIQIDKLIIAIGREPQLDFISGQFTQKAIQLESQGRLYFVGDVVNGLYRQTAIAVGDGILAAMKIHAFLKEIDL
jgi:thioredoxin reductase (NADPH)